MILPPFAYHRPESIGEALAMLSDLGEAAAVLAGGTDLLVKMKNRELRPGHLIGLEALQELAAWQTDKGQVLIGACARAADLAAGRDEGIPSTLALAAEVLGSPQVRNRATVGGNLVNARPAADLCLALLALGARAVLADSSGERKVDLADFFQGPGQSAARPQELLLRAELPRPAAGSGGGYAKLGLRRAMEIALVNVASQISLAADGRTIEQARVALGAVAPTPILSPGAASALIGQPAGEKAFDAAAAAAAADARPIDDHRGSASYRRDMVAVLTKRTLQQAWAEASGS